MHRLNRVLYPRRGGTIAAVLLLAGSASETLLNAATFDSGDPVAQISIPWVEPMPRLPEPLVICVGSKFRN